MKIALITLGVFLVTNFTFAQVVPYFSVKKIFGGLIIGVEIVNTRTNTTINYQDYRYEWTFPQISLQTYKTDNNFVFINLNESFKFLDIDLKINKIFSQENYHLKSKIVLPKPEVKILKKNKDTVLPLINLKRDDKLVLRINNFSSRNLRYIWEFNGNFISNEKELPLSLLKENSGTIRIKVYGYSPSELAEDIKFIKIED